MVMSVEESKNEPGDSLSDKPLDSFAVVYQDVLQKSYLMFHMSGRPRERLTCSTPKQIVFGAASEDINKAHAVMLIAQKLGNTKL